MTGRAGPGGPGRSAGPGRGRAAAWALLLALAMPAGLGAQLCRGAPLAAGEGRLSVLVGRPDGAEQQWGAAAAYRFGAPVAVRAGYRRTGFGDAGSEAMTTLRAGAAYELLAVPVGRTVERLSLCLTAGVERARLAELTLRTVPVGVALGTLVSLSPAWAGLLHLEPRLVHTRGQVAGLSDSALSPGVRVGAGIVHGRFVLEGGYEWVRAQRFNDVVTLELGVGFGGSEPTGDADGRNGGSRP